MPLLRATLLLAFAGASLAITASQPPPPPPSPTPTTPAASSISPSALRHHHEHHHHHEHGHRDEGRHWAAGVLLAVLGAALGVLGALGLWRRCCARLRLRSRQRYDAEATIAFVGRSPPATPPAGAHLEAPLLHPPPVAFAQVKDLPPPYKESWT